jgi:hypothetical protein
LVALGKIFKKDKSFNFFQSFVLAEQQSGYFVLNDFFLPIDEIKNLSEENEDNSTSSNVAPIEENNFEDHSSTNANAPESTDSIDEEEEEKIIDFEKKEVKEEEDEEDVLKKRNEKEFEIKPEIKRKFNQKYGIFVRVPLSVKNDQLIEAFKDCGEISEMNNKSSEKNFAFIYFKNVKSVDMAVKNNIVINGTKLIVEKIRFKPPFKRNNFKKIN